MVKNFFTTPNLDHQFLTFLAKKVELKNIDPIKSYSLSTEMGFLKIIVRLPSPDTRKIDIFEEKIFNSG